MPLLRCWHADKRTEWTVVVGEGPFTLGCSAAATVPLPDRSLAPREVQIERDGARWRVRDLAERDRVRLGSAVTREGVLKDGDRLRVGRVSIIFFEDAEGSGGQIDLRSADPAPETGPGAELSEEPAGAGAPADGPAGIPAVVWIAALLMAFAAGFSIGVFFTTRQEM
ncbi:MAG TPA: FHA domain-containing protein [Planctomycetota bacterium]|nr:FHA domain-containing protein [Planctomycetota bacterium]